MSEITTITTRAIELRSAPYDSAADLVTIAELAGRELAEAPDGTVDVGAEYPLRPGMAAVRASGEDRVIVMAPYVLALLTQK